MSKDLEAFEDIKQLISTLEFAGSKDKQWVDEELNIIEKKLKALKIIEKSGCSLEHILLIEKTKNYDEYDAQFDKYLERRYEPFRFELRKSKEEYDLLREVLL